MTSPIISNLQGPLGLARQHGVDVNPTLLGVLTDLYMQKPVHSPQDEHQFTELALRLIDMVDEKTRAIVAKKLGSPSTHDLIEEVMTLAILDLEDPHVGIKADFAR